MDQLCTLASKYPTLNDLKFEKCEEQGGPIRIFKGKGQVENAAITAVKRQLGSFFIGRMARHFLLVHLRTRSNFQSTSLTMLMIALHFIQSKHLELSGFLMEASYKRTNGWKNIMCGFRVYVWNVREEVIKGQIQLLHYADTQQGASSGGIHGRVGPGFASIQCGFWKILMRLL